MIELELPTRKTPENWIIMAVTGQTLLRKYNYLFKVIGGTLKASKDTL